jgi:eukaryotic-like serine/threonine-protein kinase
MWLTRKINDQRFDGQLTQIGSGSMSNVFKAFDTKTHGIVALKMASGNTEARTALVKEVLALSKVTHPNVVRLIDNGILVGRRFTGIHCAIMEYVEGDTLKAFLETRRMMGWDSAKPIILELCSALAAVHGAGFAHRDIKPSNIFLTAEHAKLFDFGVSSSINSAFGEVVFKPGNGYYAAPETFDSRTSRKADHRTDIYSMGVLIYRMVTGIKPVHPEFPTERGPIYISLLKTPGLAAVVGRAAAENPRDRFQTMKEMEAALGSL